QPKPRAFSKLGCDTDGPAHAFHRLANNSQADTGAFVSLDWVDAAEYLKDLVEMLRGYANAVVLEAYPRMGYLRLLVLGPYCDPWGLSRLDEFYSVAQKVRDALSEVGSVSAKLRQRFA